MGDGLVDHPVKAMKIPTLFSTPDFDASESACIDGDRPCTPSSGNVCSKSRHEGQVEGDMRLGAGG